MRHLLILNLCANAPFFRLKFSHHRISATYFSATAPHFRGKIHAIKTMRHRAVFFKKFSPKTILIHVPLSCQLIHQIFFFVLSYLLSLISWLLSPVSRLLSHLSCLISPVSPLLSHLSCLTSPVSRLLSHLSCLLSPVSCLLSHVSCLTSPVSRPLSHVPCLRCPAMCPTMLNYLATVSSHLKIRFLVI